MKKLITPLNGPAQLLKPAVYQTDTGYQIILGQEDHGVIAAGETMESAVENWNEQLRIYLQSADEDDFTVEYVKQVLESQPKPQHVKDFMSQFRPVKK